MKRILAWLRKSLFARGMSVRRRILIWVTCTVVSLVAGMVLLILHTHDGLNEQAEIRVASMLKRLKSQHRDVVNQIEAKQERYADESLRVKGNSLAGFLAEIAPVQLLTGDTEPLNDYCAQICQDEDILLCYISGPSGAICTSFQNLREKSSAGLPPLPTNGSILEAASLFRLTPDRVLEVGKDLVQDGERIGAVTLFLSRIGALRQHSETKADFGVLEGAIGELFDDLAANNRDHRGSETVAITMNGLMVGAVIIVLGTLMAIALSNSVAMPLRDAVGVLEAVASGDLSQRMRVQGKHEMGRMATALNTAVESQSHTLDALHHAKDAAEAANRAKSQFLANMSHEIRTPLNAIIGYTNLMLTGISGGTETERREQLSTVYTSGKHLLALIDDILDLSKIEADQLRLEMIACSPHEIVAGVFSLLRVRAQEKGLELKCAWSGGIPETIISDPARIRQLLMNLVGNAIKFTQRGSVTVSVEMLYDGAMPQLAIRVRDTGVGIAPDKLESIFDPFVQADSSVTRRFGGTGLGLAICRHIVEALGGTLAVQSRMGDGSVFLAQFPAEPAQDSPMLESPLADGVRAKAIEQEGPLHLPPARILLVEDGDINRKLIGLILERAGVRVVMAENGQIGLERAMAEPFDLILMDMQMPVMDGYTAATRIREAGLNVPIIALTAHAMSGDEAKCTLAGCSGYMTKPVEPDLLVRTVGLALHKNTGGQAACELEASRIEEEPPAASDAASRLSSSLPMDDADFREIVIEFVDRMREQIAAMHEALAAGNCDELSRLAHWLKGSGGTAGFAVFTEPAKQLEQSARRGDVGEAAAMLVGISALAARITAPSCGPVLGGAHHEA